MKLVKKKIELLLSVSHSLPRSFHEYIFPIYSVLDVSSEYINITA